ncbi:hypothetical protein [Corynebacterium qintianiae]|nr:hypothetical protein [Corynebacterium qintianiae]
MARDFNVAVVAVTVIAVVAAAYFLSEGTWAAPLVVFLASLLAIFSRR